MGKYKYHQIFEGINLKLDFFINVFAIRYIYKEMYEIISFYNYNGYFGCRLIIRGIRDISDYLRKHV